MKAIKRVELARMPFDKWTGTKYVHATGYEVILDNGDTVIEYEDNEYEDSEDCEYEREMWDYYLSGERMI